MSNTQDVHIEIAALRFFSSQDEEAFFEWLAKIGSVTEVYGRGLSIHIQVACEKATEADVRGLIALFHRYGIPMKQLSFFDVERFSPWFRDKSSYWFDSVFGSHGG